MSEMIIDAIYKMIDFFRNNKKEDIDLFVKDTYRTVEKIYSDYSCILKQAELEVKKGNMSIDDAVLYFDEKRLPFKSARAHIRGMMKHPYFQKSEKLGWFSIGVLGVLQGGLHDSTERSLNAKMSENAIILHDEIQMKGYHTIVDIIGRYDRNNKNSLFYAERFANWDDRTEVENVIKQCLLSDIKKQEEKIDQSWQLVCDYYPRLIK